MTEPYDYVMLEIGLAGELHRQALREAIRNTKRVIDHLSPLTAIDFAIGGYDDDPRELWEIPEARHFIIEFAAGLMKAGIPANRLLPTSINVVRCCIAAEEGNPVGLGESSDIGKELRDYQARVRRTMQ